MSFQIKVEKLFSKGAVGSYFRPQNYLFAIVWVSGRLWGRGKGSKETEKKVDRLFHPLFSLPSPYFKSPASPLTPKEGQILGLFFALEHYQSDEPGGSGIHT